MIIETEVKLDFKDVLIRPKRSTLKSRSQVNLERTFKFKHVKDFEWTVIPIMVSNMDTTGTFEMAQELTKNKIFTSIHKYYDINEWLDFRDLMESLTLNLDYVSVTSGISEADLSKLDNIITNIPEIKFISLDVAL